MNAGGSLRVSTPTLQFPIGGLGLVGGSTGVGCGTTMGGLTIGSVGVTTTGGFSTGDVQHPAGLTTTTTGAGSLFTTTGVSS